MGEDGHILIIRASDVDASEFADLSPSVLGWRRRKLFGADVWWRYWDTRTGDDHLDSSPAEYALDHEWAEHSLAAPPSRMRWDRERALRLADQAATDIGHPVRMAQSRRWLRLDAWLDARADTWEVWT
jgi:hypothetical protein